MSSCKCNPVVFKRILSSDIKVYTYPSINLRAYLPENTHILPDNWQGHEDALVILGNGQGNVIHGDGLPVLNTEYPAELEQRPVLITSYNNTRVTLLINAPNDTYLIFNDAYYPGWKATVNGEATPVYRANTMFRAVQVPEGASTVVVHLRAGLVADSVTDGFGGVADIRCRASCNLEKTT